MKTSEFVYRISQNKERLKSQGKVIDPGVLPLDKGDPDFSTPEHICDAAREAMRQGHTHYVSGAGDNELISAICDNLKETYSCSFTPEGVIITNGAMEAIYLACTAFLSPGDEIIVFTPGYNYAGAILMVGAVPVWVSLTADFRLDFDAIKNAITKNTKAILVCNPNNPTGTSFTRSDVEFLAETAIKNDLLLISDEVYRALYYGGRTHFCAGSLPEIKDRLILIDSFSKTYAMTGWRIGYVAALPTLTRPMYMVHRVTLSSISAPTQRAALAALRGPQDCVGDMVTEYDRRRKAIIERLKGIHGFSYVVPDSAFYFYGRFDAAMKSSEMVEYLYSKKVAVRSGTEFGYSGEGYIRLTYAIPYDEVVKGIELLGDAFIDLNS